MNCTSLYQKNKFKKTKNIDKYTSYFFSTLKMMLLKYISYKHKKNNSKIIKRTSSKIIIMSSSNTY